METQLCAADTCGKRSNLNEPLRLKMLKTRLNEGGLEQDPIKNNCRIKLCSTCVTSNRIGFSKFYTNNALNNCVEQAYRPNLLYRNGICIA